MFLACSKPSFIIIFNVLNRNRVVNSLKGGNIRVWHLQDNDSRTNFTLLNVCTVSSKGLGVMDGGKLENVLRNDMM